MTIITTCELQYPDVIQTINTWSPEEKEAYNVTAMLDYNNPDGWRYCSPELVFSYKMKSAFYLSAFALLCILFMRNFSKRLIRYGFRIHITNPPMLISVLVS